MSPLLRRKPLPRGQWNRTPPPTGSSKRPLYEESRRRQRAAEKRDDALTEGCEYKEFLKQWWRLFGCAACGRHRGVVLHHTKHRSQKGRAEWQVPICPIPCHVEDGRGIEGRALEDHGVDLHETAKMLADEGRKLGYLPVEMCDSCGDWHSTKLILNQLGEGDRLARVCGKCAGEGPP